jgi:hypothetical protein
MSTSLLFKKLNFQSVLTLAIALFASLAISNTNSNSNNDINNNNQIINNIIKNHESIQLVSAHSKILCHKLRASSTGALSCDGLPGDKSVRSVYMSVAGTKSSKGAPSMVGSTLLKSHQKGKSWSDQKAPKKMATYKSGDDATMLWSTNNHGNMKNTHSVQSYDK